MDGWMDGWMKGRLRMEDRHGWIDRWMDGHVGVDGWKAVRWKVDRWMG